MLDGVAIKQYRSINLPQSQCYIRWKNYSRDNWKDKWKDLSAHSILKSTKESSLDV